MSIQLEQYDNVGVIRPAIDLRAELCPDFHKVIEDIRDNADLSSVVIDFTHVRYIDGRGLEALLWAKDQMTRPDAMAAGIRLAAVDANCRKILEMTRLNERFEIHADVHAALSLIQTFKA